MIPTLANAVMLVAMCVILMRCICVVPRLSRKGWTGHRAHFAALAGTYALLGGGAVGTALHWPLGPTMLIAGVAGWVLFDREISAMMMLIPSDYWMGRDVKYADQLTDKIRDNAAELIGRVNLLITWAMRENIRPTAVASGWRPPAVNDATSNSAAHSRHLTGEAVDLRDNGVRDLASWCLRNLDALEEIGLYMEDPQWTPTWVHLQIVPPGSRRRVYIPSTKPPLVAMLPEQEQGLGEIRVNLLLGMVTRNPMLLLWIALGAFAAGAVSGGGAAWTVQGWRLDAVKAEFKGFVDTTRALGEAAQKLSDATKVADQKRKDQADAENKRTIDSLRADVKRLRDARAGGSFVPAAPAGARRPELACFDRPELERAIRGFDLGVQGLVDEGSEAAVNLDTARTWARPP